LRKIGTTLCFFGCGVYLFYCKHLFLFLIKRSFHVIAYSWFSGEGSGKKLLKEPSDLCFPANKMNF
jgi:hypothetical protein